MLRRIIAATAAASSASFAGIDSVNLNNYVLSATHALPFPAASEASAVTYNWDTGTLFVLGDEGESIVEVTTTGALVGAMTLTGFEDTEGLTYIGGGAFVIGEERLQDVFRLTYTSGGSVSRDTLQTASIGPTVGNIGIEGFTYDPRNGRFVLVKEKSPQAVYDTAIAFGDPPAGSDINPAALFDAALLGVLDLSDVQALATVPSLSGTADEDNLLIYSQESALLMEVTRSGTILSTFDFGAIADDAEGVTIDADGVIYVVGETPALYVLTPIPAPGAAGLIGLAGLAALRRRR